MTVARRRSGSRSETASKRAALLVAAEEQFRLHGVRRTSMEGIAETAQVAKATAYAYFRNKEEVFHAVCESVITRISAGIDEASQRPLSAPLRVAAIAEAKFVLLYELVHRSPHAADLLESSDRIAAEIVERGDAYFHQMLRKALIAASVPAREATELATLIEQSGWGISQLADNAAQLSRRLHRLIHALLLR
jgi:TetR/AcrR family transcriptional regulator